jgi:hypothetical protein
MCSFSDRGRPDSDEQGKEQEAYSDATNLDSIGASKNETKGRRHLTLKPKGMKKSSQFYIVLSLLVGSTQIATSASSLSMLPALLWSRTQTLQFQASRKNHASSIIMQTPCLHMTTTLPASL